MTLRDDLDKLATAVAKKAALSATTLQESVDALKALTPYYALTEKLRAKGDDGDEPDGDTFEAFSAAVAGTEERANGHGAKVRSRRRDS